MKSSWLHHSSLFGLLLFIYPGTPSYAQKPTGASEAKQIEGEEDLQFLRDRTPAPPGGIPYRVLSGRLPSLTEFQGNIIIQNSYLTGATEIIARTHPNFPDSGEIIVRGNISSARNFSDEELDGLDESKAGVPTPGMPGENGHSLTLNAARHVKIFSNIDLSGQRGGAGGQPDLFHCEGDSYPGQDGGKGGNGGNLAIEAGVNVYFIANPLMSPSLMISTRGGNGGSGSSAPNFFNARPTFIAGLNGGNGSNGGMAGEISISAGMDWEPYTDGSLPKIAIRGTNDIQPYFVANGGAGGNGGSGSNYSLNGGNGGHGGEGGDGNWVALDAPLIEGFLFGASSDGNHGGDAGAGGSGWRGGRYECGCNQDELCGPGGPGGHGGNGGASGFARKILFSRSQLRAAPPNETIRLSGFSLSAQSYGGGLGGGGGAAGGTFLDPIVDCPIQFSSAGNGGFGGSVAGPGEIEIESDSVDLDNFLFLAGTHPGGDGGNGGDNSINVCVRPSICERGGSGGRGGNAGVADRVFRAIKVEAAISLTANRGLIDCVIQRSGHGGRGGLYDVWGGFGGDPRFAPPVTLKDIFKCGNPNQLHLSEIGFMTGHEVGEGRWGARTPCPEWPR